MPRANEVGLTVPVSLGQWIWIRRQYRICFPREERKPFSVILSMCRKGKTDVFCILAEGRLVGFAATINGEREILLDYLAVQQSRRGTGIGSAALRKLRERYAGKGLFVEIESPYEPGADQQVRLRRKAFYQNCGMKQMRVMADVFGVNMELLGWDCSLDFDGYKEFYRKNYGSWAAEHLTWKPYPAE